MRVRVLLFAAMRERLGTAGLDLELAPGARVADAIAALEVRHPGLTEQRFVCAVDETYATPSTPLNEGSALALIPPVSGG
ncbi:MAG: MoaD/ThiS family protein [Planctomycetes bacterium]|nr:MoaD/ThiS family protein [Planctomycetota bacterium]